MECVTSTNLCVQGGGELTRNGKGVYENVKENLTEKTMKIKCVLMGEEK
jgi:hypothetical protein